MVKTVQTHTEEITYSDVTFHQRNTQKSVKQIIPNSFYSVYSLSTKKLSLSLSLSLYIYIYIYKQMKILTKEDISIKLIQVYTTETSPCLCVS